ncbi:hypothetical protein GQ43DRAFT_441768 [Delitschia confertaspora ATCC 74209]|uniref:Uncharacterized protein n=1 Tax=Delitschia confertaspora ATCC 74209 TaxID=1513339 RepID=A0A9P4JN83_9PLEO|nr:hypothetical protein GQ43DRAFT_441768 [Delitschia confertaspora ATCC 74209]
MQSLLSIRMFLVIAILFFTAPFGVSAQRRPSTTSTVARAPTTPPSTGRTSTRVSNSPSSGTSATTTAPPVVETTSTPPDVYLNVPTLSVGRIELDVDDLQADINLNAKVAGLVTINAGVQVSVKKINVTIADVGAELELIVRLGHLVDIVERVFESLDLNPLLIGLINNVTSLIGDVVGAVDGLLGSITQGGTTLNFLIDNLGNIVQEVVGGAGGAVSSIVGNYQQNMTQVGDIKQLGNGLTQKTFSYGALGALVDIVFNTAGQVVQATVQKKQGGGGGGGGGGGSTTSASGSPTATPVTLPVSSSTSIST